MLAQRSPSAYICPRCLSKQLRSFSSSPRRTLAQLPPSSGITKLTTRRLISLRGQDAAKFLQGLITNNVRVDSESGFYAAFLTAPGKVLHDTFIYPSSGSEWQKQQGSGEGQDYLIEVDAEQADHLLKHLKRHKLRSKLSLRLLENGELDVWSLWKEGERWTAHGQAGPHSSLSGAVSLADCRAPGMGQRILLPDADAGRISHEAEQASLEHYTVRRYLKGVAEGQREMPRDDCLPMNCNIDIMGGIDFRKGCYLGQELTIRTHHTGVVRRRILPVQLYPAASQPPEALSFDTEAPIDAASLTGGDIRRDDKRKRSTGKLIAAVGNVGLGMCRLEQMSDLTISGEGSSFAPSDTFIVEDQEGNAVGVKAFVPDWLRGRIREPKLQKRVE